MWLRRPLDAPTSLKQLILADAFVAMNPGARLWKAYNAEIDKLRSTGEISEEDAHFLMLAQESRSALMDLTLGDDEAYTEGTAMEVLRRAEEMRLQISAQRSSVSDQGVKRRRQCYRRGPKRTSDLPGGSDA